LSQSEVKKPILTICPEDYPGTTAVLTHYNVTGLVEHSDTVSPETVKDRKMVIFGGWHPVYYEAMKKVASAGVPIGLFWTSSVGQTDFSNNGVEVSYLHLIMDLLNAGLINKLFVATESVQSMYQRFIKTPDSVVHLPYAFDFDPIEKSKDKTLKPGDRWVDLFCPGDTRKNILVQTHGAALANAHLHYSGLKTRYKWFADLMHMKYTDMGWMQKNSYYKAVQTMKLGLQVTYAETFDYVVAEHFALERPCLISTVMDSWVDKSLWDDLMVYNIDDPFEVQKKIENILDMPNKEWKALNKNCYNFMQNEAERRNEIVKKVLNGVIE
jgi:hypothetical protein